MVTKYKINIKRFSEPWYEQAISETLDMYLKGGDIKQSPLTVKSAELAAEGLWNRPSDVWNEDSQNYEECFREREQSLIDLYYSMKKDGYNGSVISARFDNTGAIYVYDGYHRLCVMKYLGIDADLNVDVQYDDVNHDFPLVDTIIATDIKGKRTYQPVLDKRVKGFTCDRADSFKRLDYLLTHLVGSTVLDIGCSEGYFAMELAKRGYKVTAIDADPNKAAITRYLSTINNIDIDCHHAHMENFLHDGDHYDNILFFSVFHNTLATSGIECAYSELKQLSDKACRVFFEYPNADEFFWKDHYRDNPINSFIGDDFKHSVELHTGMQVLDKWKCYRPMLLLGNDSAPTGIREFKHISDAEWKDHSTWEADWWRGCSNTLDEQIKQDTIYIPYMKLDQYNINRKFMNMRGKSILDIGGGPVSILLRCVGFSRAVVVDPCDYPDWVELRYKDAGIEYIKEKAESVGLDINVKFDECWIYNVLQHVQDPVKVIDTAKQYSKKIRIFEPLEIGEHKGHPHNLTEELLDNAFGKKGLVDHVADGQIYYYGVFRYEE